MPITPAHWSIAYLLREIRPSLSLPALIVSTAMPDLEIPFIYIMTGGQLGRLVLHSFLGAATIATVLSIVFTVRNFAYGSEFFCSVKKPENNLEKIKQRIDSH